jgi:hypothetical protein
MPTRSNRHIAFDQLFMPWWATIWTIIGSLVCIWDATYILYRPRTMANGDLFHLYFPYAKYITLDPLYGNLRNAFVLAQSWLNLVEITLTLLSVTLYHAMGRRNLGCLLLLIVSVMTWAKTMLYFVHDHFQRELYPQDSSSIKIATYESICLFIIPSLIWIVCPFACMWTIARQILCSFNNKNIKMN